MLISAIVALFKYKVVGSVIIIANWSTFEKVKVSKQFSEHGVRISFSNNPASLETAGDYRLHGVMYVQQQDNRLPLEKVPLKYFSNQYKWLIVAPEINNELNHARYDSDIVLFCHQVSFQSNGLNSSAVSQNKMHFFHDVYVHPRDGVSLHAWARWIPSTGIIVDYDWERILRRQNLNEYPLRITVPVVHYSEDTYHGTFAEYLVDLTVPDPGVRCGYGASALLIESINATEVLIPTLFWVSDENNSSMPMLESGSVELNAGVLRILMSRLNRVDYVMPIYLFSVGFTYLAERESSNNMYVEPFSASVWCCCLGVGVVLALALRLTSRKIEEKEGAFIAALATWLQQDASAVPSGISGRWTFTVLSVCSMLVHAYYTSAIVSSLMSTGRGGPRTLRELGDSRYAIASEDLDFIRIMFDVKTTWADLEYLKKKKLTSNIYHDFKYGVQVIQQGYTAYHAEYHQLYPYLNILSDDEICKMQHIDTIPQAMTWVTTNPKGQWTNLLRTAGAWLQETGLAKRLIQRIQLHPPPCRSALLAERVTFWDVSPLLAVTVLAAVMSCGLLGLEITVAKWRRQSKNGSGGSVFYNEDIEMRFVNEEIDKNS